MNESEIDRAVERFASHPVLGKGARFLSAFRDEVNAHSDGWCYWPLPSKAANKLVSLLNGHLLAGMGAYPRLPEPTEADLTKAITPIKAFYARRGYAAGMKLPPLSEAKPKPETITLQQFIDRLTALPKEARSLPVTWCSPATGNCYNLESTTNIGVAVLRVRSGRGVAALTVEAEFVVVGR